METADLPRSWTAAGFFRSRGQDVVCTLCPHACVLAEGEVGFCGVRRRRRGNLETATFASTVRHLAPVERKPLYHYRPGSRTLTLAAPGCSFTCAYCQNYRISQLGRVPEAVWRAESVDPEEVVAAAAVEGAAVALSYSEPSLAAELTLALAEAGRRRGVDVVWKTNGFLTREATARIAPALAAVNVDVKSVDEVRHRTLTGAPVAPVLDALADFVAAGVWAEVSTPLIPGISDDPAALQRIAGAIARISPEIPWHLLRFTPEFRMKKARPTHPDALRRAVDVGHQTGLRYVYVERALGEDGRTTCCPDCGAPVIERDIWATRRVGLRDGACPDCGTSIPGRW